MTPRKKVASPKPLKIFRIPVKSECFVHASSPIISNYWERYGQPFPSQIFDVSCFDAVIVKEPLAKQKPRIWLLEIPALFRDGTAIFEATEEQLQNSPVFTRSVIEPDDWIVQSAGVLHEMFKLQEQLRRKKQAINVVPKPQAQPPVNIYNMPPEVFKELTRIPTPTPGLSQPTTGPLHTPINLTGIADNPSSDLENDDTQFFDTQEIDEIQFETQYSGIEATLDLQDEEMLQASVITLVESRVGKDDDLWEEMNKYFETKYGLAKSIHISASPEDITKVINFMHDVSSKDLKDLGLLWLDKFNNFSDQHPKVGRPVLRDRTSNLNTQFFINGDGLSSADNISTHHSPMAHHSSTDHDLSFLPDTITTIPELRSVDLKFNAVKVSYNELDNFFQKADRTTKFENIYDLLCVQAGQTMYTENPK